MEKELINAKEGIRLMRNRWIHIFDKITEYSLYAIIFFIPISNAAIESFFGFALLGYIIKKSLKPDFAPLKSKPVILLGMFLILNALSLLNSGPYLYKGFKALVFKWTEYALIFLIAQDVLSEPKRLKNAMAVFLFSATLIGFDGLFQKFTGIDFLRHKPLFIRPGFSSISASFSHYNSLGAYLIFMLPLTIALILISGTKRIYKMGFVLQAALLATCLFMTFSRGSWIGFVAALLFMLCLAPTTKQVLLLIGIYLIFLIIMLSADKLRQRVVFTFQPQGDADRLILWKASLGIIKENPWLGKGLGTFMDYFHKYNPTLYVQYAHNCFLQIWAEIGIFGLLSFILFISSVLVRAIKTFHASADPFLLGLACGMFGFLVHSFFDTNLYTVQLSALFWVSAGIVMAIVNAGLTSRAK